MRKSFTLFIVALSFSMTAGAQSYTDHVQQKRSGMGTVTITQSQAIDDLVNGRRQRRAGRKRQTTRHINPSLLPLLIIHNLFIIHNLRISHRLSWLPASVTLFAVPMRKWRNGVMRLLRNGLRQSVRPIMR